MNTEKKYTPFISTRAKTNRIPKVSYSLKMVSQQTLILRNFSVHLQNEKLEKKY